MTYQLGGLLVLFQVNSSCKFSTICEKQYDMKLQFFTCNIEHLQHYNCIFAAFEALQLWETVLGALQFKHFAKLKIDTILQMTRATWPPCIFAREITAQHSWPLCSTSDDNPANCSKRYYMILPCHSTLLDCATLLFGSSASCQDLAWSQEFSFHAISGYRITCRLVSANHLPSFASSTSTTWSTP